MGSKAGADKIAAKRIGISYEEYMENKQKGLKWCTHCKKFVKISEFGKDGSRADGLSSKCFKCRRADNKFPDRVDKKTRREMKNKGMLYCSKCEKFLPKDEMTKNGVRKKHANEAARKRYHENEAVRMTVYQYNYSRKRKLNKIPKWYIEQMREDFSGKCAYCGKKATTIDHIIPVSKGGNSVPGNVVPACQSCNSSKKNKDLFKWIEENEKRLDIQSAFFSYLETHYAGLYSTAQ